MATQTGTMMTDSNKEINKTFQELSDQVNETYQELSDKVNEHGKLIKKACKDYSDKINNLQESMNEIMEIMLTIQKSRRQSNGKITEQNRNSLDARCKLESEVQTNENFKGQTSNIEENKGCDEIYRNNGNIDVICIEGKDNCDEVMNNKMYVNDNEKPDEYLNELNHGNNADLVQVNQKILSISEKIIDSAQNEKVKCRSQIHISKMQHVTIPSQLIVKDNSGNNSSDQYCQVYRQRKNYKVIRGHAIECKRNLRNKCNVRVKIKIKGKFSKVRERKIGCNGVCCNKMEKSCNKGVTGNECRKMKSRKSVKSNNRKKSGNRRRYYVERKEMCCVTENTERLKYQVITKSSGEPNYRERGKLNVFSCMSEKVEKW